MLNDLLLFDKMSLSQCKELSPLSLAFVGDAVWTLLVREYFCEKTTLKNNPLHRLSTKLVKASFQATAFQEIEKHFTEDEEAVAKRARNVKLNTTAKNASLSDYRKATSFEAVIGFVYLQGDKERLNFFVDKLLSHFEEVLSQKLAKIE